MSSVSSVHARVCFSCCFVSDLLFLFLRVGWRNGDAQGRGEEWWTARSKRHEANTRTQAGAEQSAS